MHERGEHFPGINTKHLFVNIICRESFYECIIEHCYSVNRWIYIIIRYFTKYVTLQLISQNQNIICYYVNVHAAVRRFIYTGRTDYFNYFNGISIIFRIICTGVHTHRYILSKLTRMHKQFHVIYYVQSSYQILFVFVLFW